MVSWPKQAQGWRRPVLAGRRRPLCCCAKKWNGRTTRCPSHAAFVRLSNSSSRARPSGFMVRGPQVPCPRSGVSTYVPSGSHARKYAWILAANARLSVRWRTDNFSARHANSTSNFNAIANKQRTGKALRSDVKGSAALRNQKYTLTNAKDSKHAN